MEDQYVVLLERVVAENVRLREAMEARDNEQRRMFEELASKIESSNTEPERSGRSSRKRRRKISVPQQCRVSINISVTFLLSEILWSDWLRPRIVNSKFKFTCSCSITRWVTNKTQRDMDWASIFIYVLRSLATFVTVYAKRSLVLRSFVRCKNHSKENSHIKMGQSHSRPQSPCLLSRDLTATRALGNSAQP